MTTWVIPYVDQTTSFWSEVHARFAPAIAEVYFPLPTGIIASGRGRQPSDYIDTFLRDVPLPKAVLLNPVVLSRPVEEIAPPVLAALKHLYETYGVSRVTITNLTLARLIREALPEFMITASVLMGIATPAQVLLIRDDVDALTAGNTLVRDLRGLRRLRDVFSGELRLIVNEACLPGCPYRTQHFFEMAYGETFLPQSLCAPLLARHPWLRLTGGWVLPQHLHYYDGTCDVLKLAGRVTLRQRDTYLTVLDAYVNRKPLLPKDIGGGPASVLAPMSMPDDLFEFVLNCDKNCCACTICRDAYQRACATGANAEIGA